MSQIIIYVIVSYCVLLIIYLSTYRSFNKKLSYKLTENNFVINKIPKLSLILVTLILSIYSAKLAMTGYLSDTVRYAWSFTYRYPLLYDTLQNLFDAKTEFGFLLLVKSIKYFTDNPFWMFFVISFVTTLINLYVAFKISKKYLIITFLYLFSIYFFQSTYLIRQTIAVSIGNLALLSLFKGFNIRYFLFSFLALAFHSTSIILFPMFFVLKKIKSFKGYFYIIVISIFIFFLFSPIINGVIQSIPYLEEHLNQEALLENAIGTFSTIIKGMPFFLLTLLALVRRKKIIEITDKADIFIVSSFLYSLSFIFSYNMYWSFRMGWYFLIPTLALIPIVFSTYKNPIERIVYILIFLFILLVVTFRQIYITLN